MANPLFNMFGNNQPRNNNNNILAQFQQFAQNFQGDPKQRVQELLNNGTMTREQFDQLSNIANTIFRRN